MSHALTLRNDFLREHSPVLAISVLLHLALLGLLILNLNLMPRRQQMPVRLAIQATVVDGTAMRQRAAERDRQKREAAERLRQQEADRQQYVADQRQADERQAQQRQIEDQKRKEQAEVERRDQAKRQQDVEKARQAKLEQQRLDAEQQKQAAADARRKADAERRAAQSKADLARQMAEEENLVAAADSGELDQYMEVIRQKVRRNWTQPASARPGDSCDVRVQQIPGGEIVSAVATNCTGDAAFARSVEAAVLRSSPLPPPPNPALFERNLLFNFKPEI
jgi:colicin import membrane protein